MKLTRIEAVEIPKVNQFTRRINFSLECGLTLVEHCRCVDLHSPFSNQEFSTALKDGTPCLQTHVDPSVLCIDRRLASCSNFRLARLVYIGNDMAMFVRDDLCGCITGKHLLAIDDARDFDYLCHLPV